MNRRKLLKGLTLAPLAGAALAISPLEAEAQKKKRNEWMPKKKATRPGQPANVASTDNKKWPPSSILSGCVRSGHLLFMSGIGGWYPEQRAEAGDVKVQIQSALAIMKEVLEEAGSSMANVLKVHMTVVEPNQNIARLNEGYRGHFPEPAPVRSYTGCGADQMGRDGLLVQVDCIAYVD